MIRLRHHGLLLVSLVVIGGAFCVASPTRRFLARVNVSQSDEPASLEEPVTMEDLTFGAYDVNGKRYTVSAATASLRFQRLGFLQTALVPTVELHDVVIDRAGAAGAAQRMELPRATVDWSTKTVRDPSGAVILSDKPSFH